MNYTHGVNFIEPTPTLRRCQFKLSALPLDFFMKSKAEFLFLDEEPTGEFCQRSPDIGYYTTNEYNVIGEA